MALIWKLWRRSPLALAYLFPPASSQTQAGIWRLGNGISGRELTSCSLQQLSWFSSRPRGPLWRSRKVMSKEAVHAALELRRAKESKVALNNIMKSKIARLLKMDLLAVLEEMQRQEDVDLALKVFEAVRKEVWYKPDVYLYKDMMACLGRHNKVEECEQLFKDLKGEGLMPGCDLCTELMAAYLRVGRVADAMEAFEDMKRTAPPDRSTYKILMKGLRQLNQKELRAKVKKEYLEFFEGIEAEDEDFASKMEEES